LKDFVRSLGIAFRIYFNDHLPSGGALFCDRKIDSQMTANPAFSAAQNTRENWKNDRSAARFRQDRNRSRVRPQFRRR
jgi:hypothetical protein